MPVITARIPERLLGDLEKVEKEEHTDRAEVIRKLLSQAVKDWKIKKTLELLKEHKITYRKAAKMAGLSYPEIIDLAAKAQIDAGYTLEDLKKDMER